MEHLMDAEGKSRVSARDEPPFVRLSFLTTSFNVGYSDLGMRVENVTVGEFWLNVEADCGSEWSHRGWFFSSMVILDRVLSVPLWAAF